MRLLGKWNWWLPFAGVQHHPPALAEYLGSPDDINVHARQTATLVVENVSMREK
jgi:hypothetical protein